MDEYLSRILHVLNVPLEKTILDGHTKGWRCKKQRSVICGVEYALIVPVGLSYTDAEKRLDGLIATCGKLVELEDYKGTLVVRVVTKEWAHPMRFKPEHIRKNQLLIGYNRMFEPVYHPLNVHLLCAGAARAGKTDWLRWVMYQLILQDYEVHCCDLKSFSFFPFEGIVNIAKSLSESRDVLSFAVSEMNRRKSVILQSRNRSIIDGFRPVVIVIDEAASLSPSQNSGKSKIIAKECDEYISLLGQQSREPKIFVIYATQRPDMNIINKQFKANVEASIAFRTKDQVNSRIILDREGAERISPSTPGRCIYSYDRNHLLQVPYIGDDDDWTKLLMPLKQEVIHEGHSARNQPERIYFEGVTRRTDRDNQAAVNSVSKQPATQQSQLQAKGTTGRKTGGMGMAPANEGVASHSPRALHAPIISDEI